MKRDQVTKPVDLVELPEPLMTGL